MLGRGEAFQLGRFLFHDLLIVFCDIKGLITSVCEIIDFEAATFFSRRMGVRKKYSKKHYDVNPEQFGT